MVVFRLSSIECALASIRLVHPVKRPLMGSGRDSLIRFACPIFISVLNVPFPTHGIEHLAGKWGQSIFKTLKVGNLTGEIRYLLFPAFDIINVTGQLG
jgi:hypothetical protein